MIPCLRRLVYGCALGVVLVHEHFIEEPRRRLAQAEADERVLVAIMLGGWPSESDLRVCTTAIFDFALEQKQRQRRAMTPLVAQLAALVGDEAAWRTYADAVREARALPRAQPGDDFVRRRLRDAIDIATTSQRTATG